MPDTIEQAKSDFLQAKDRMCAAFAAVPDDRINWSPSPTARTPLQVVAHSAHSVKNLHGILSGHPFECKTPAEADLYFREWETQFNTRQEVLDVLDQHSEAYLTWLETEAPQRLDTMVEMPFGLGSLPVRVAIMFEALHLGSHIPQLEYIQTIYGDRDWHM